MSIKAKKYCVGIFIAVCIVISALISFEATIFMGAAFISLVATVNAWIFDDPTFKEEDLYE